LFASQSINTYSSQVIAVYNYQNSDDVFKRIITVYQAIREELTRTSLAHFQLGHDFIDLVSCWDRFFEFQQNEMVKFGKDFVENGIEKMAARWVDDSEMSDSLRKTAHAVRETLKALKGKIDEIYMNTPAPNYRPTTY
jgi:hypothetical protein